MSAKGDPKDAVVAYLKLQNRPYSANDITQNLHKEFGKTSIQKALDELTVNGLIKEKIYGKQKVYAPLQEDVEQGKMEAALSELDSMIAEVNDKYNKTEQELKVVESELKEFSNQLTTEEALKQKEDLLQSVERLRNKLEQLTGNSVQISDAERKTITKKFDEMAKEYRKRKRICSEISSAILENYPKTKKAFYEEVGIETDESAAG